MRLHLILFGLLIASGLMAGVSGCQPDTKSPAGLLKNVDARQAIAIANEWKWSQKDIKSHVTSREVVFEFTNGKSKRISLPEDHMMVAVAPYVGQTHR